MSTEVEYDPRELIYRTPGAETGLLMGVNIWAETSDREMVVLCRRGEHDDSDPEELCGMAAAKYLAARFPGFDPHDRGAQWEFDWGHAKAGESGVWTPDPEALGCPLERASLREVVSVGETPLGATRGRSGSDEDYRWLYVTRNPAKPSHPLKRLTSTYHELSRPSVREKAWGRINYPLRDRPDFYLRLTAGTPRAAVLVSVNPAEPLPCRLRADLDDLVDYLGRHVNREDDREA